MSDLCSYELEDIVWDELCQSDDHIVPQPDDEQKSENLVQGDTRKRPRREVTGVSTTAGEQYADMYVREEKEEGHFPIVKNRKNTMLGKDSWAHTSENVLPTSCEGDSVKEAKNLASDSSISSHCFKSSNMGSIGTDFCADDATIDDGCGAVDGNSYHYPLDHISQTDNNLSFFDNDREDKESSDLFYYGWPDIENFEDVDRMFRNCDSTFGLTGIGNEDELGWFSSSHVIEGSEDVLNSDLKFTCPQSSESKSIQHHLEPSRLYNASSESASVSNQCSSQTLEDDEPAAVGRLSFLNRSDAIPETKDDSTARDKINSQKKHAKHENQSEGKRKGQSLENGNPYHHVSAMQFQDIECRSGNSSSQGFLSQQMQNIKPGSFGYLQAHDSYMHLDYTHLSDQISTSTTMSSIKSENNGLSSLAPKESSYASYQMQHMKNFQGHAIEGPAISINEKREKGHLQQGSQPSSTINKKHNLVVQTANRPVSVPTQIYHSESKVGNHSEVDAVTKGIPAELDSSNVQESSSMNSGLDEVSLEATSFRQLQHVMEQLDTRTKLCIRDSLYRLARSAEQRHNHVNMIGSSGDGKETGGVFMNDGTNNGLMDIETDTNPIDRSIAHLLFHRPSESSAMPAYDALPFKSHTMAHGSITSPPTKTEKQARQEETDSEADKRTGDH